MFLTGEGYHVGKLTSDLMPSDRINVMEAFRTKKITHLITTNLLARGFDQRSVTLVINIGIPFHYDS
jgi:superfamily II DNA/RNA helicase